MATGWLTASAADVPPGDGWLSPRERGVSAGLRMDRRRSDWRLGRWAAKRAVAATLGVAADRVEILAAADGAPEAWLGDHRAELSVSLSHRADRAIAVVAPGPAVVGCDLELVESRSPAFIREWLPESEQAQLAQLGGSDRARLANLLWCAREAAAKVRREGLRLDVRRAGVELGDASVPAWAAMPPGAWRPLRVLWEDAGPTAGWWREEPGWVMTVASTPAQGAPRRLAA